MRRPSRHETPMDTDDLTILADEAEVLASRLFLCWDAARKEGPDSPCARRLLALQHRAERRTGRRQAKLEAT